MAAIVLTDIEGTISDVDFVRNVLFPHARDALPEFVAEHGSEPAVAAQLVAAAADGGLDANDTAGIVSQLQRWIDEDRKVTALKALQGMIWRHGYESGAFQAHLYPDAWRWLAERREAGTPIHVYSSGSVQAQELYFAHTTFGNLLDWFSGFFDTRIGHKREAASYAAIVEAIGAPAGEIAFFSDVVEELDAAGEAGLIPVLLDRAEQLEGARWPRYSSFDLIDLESL